MTGFLTRTDEHLMWLRLAREDVHVRYFGMVKRNLCMCCVCCFPSEACLPPLALLKFVQAVAAVELKSYSCFQQAANVCLCYAPKGASCAFRCIVTRLCVER